jgi:hypothetical protein
MRESREHPGRSVLLLPLHCLVRNTMRNTIMVLPTYCLPQTLHHRTDPSMLVRGGIRKDVPII